MYSPHKNIHCNIMNNIACDHNLKHRYNLSVDIINIIISMFYHNFPLSVSHNALTNDVLKTTLT